MRKIRKFVYPKNDELQDQIQEIIAKTRKADAKSRRIAKTSDLEINKKFTHDFSYLDGLSFQEQQERIKKVNERLDDFLDRNYVARESNEMSKNFSKNLKEIYNIELDKDLTRKQIEDFAKFFPEFSSLTKPSSKSAKEGIDEMVDTLIDNSLADSNYGIDMAVKSVGGQIKVKRKSGRSRKR